uniref:Uncharacterized protein n=1 Tax=Anguilla anguilla TaxID=7936 RepID=A0A0E9VGJ0_ANGAN
MCGGVTIGFCRGEVVWGLQAGSGRIGQVLLGR